MRPIWTGSIGFGLVNIPVKIYTAIESKKLELDMLDKADHAHIKYLRVNENTGKEVKWENIVKGYKWEDHYVVLEDEDFEAANAKKTKLIEISDFVKIQEIDQIFYENAYYLEPDKSGKKAYLLLKEALLKTGKVGVATFVMRNKENLAVLRPTDKMILLHRLHFAQEIRKPDELDLPEKSDIKGKELEMAVTLINQTTGEFDIDQYKDTYVDELMKIIEKKAKGVKKTAPKFKVVHSKSQDLMEQLKASLDMKRKKAS
ncbi:MAG TPA: Ku protein [Bacteroidales bacterium]|nr:Ku protein [Bacteroidales bacterium]